ncbi:DUF1992 domain-containing protein [Micromonospora zhanjiangensis]|uniref:DUF1992 domain-containing protein n=1 Tax=Micromonospora zhanjiangensis TaxID=1522057 RepID=A0ABV8KEH2_9ACTN
MSDASNRLESLVDAQLRAARERGEFDNLPGAGKPLPKRHSPDDELWWIKDYIAREGLPTDALLPPALRLAREIEHLPGRVAGLAAESLVREAVADLNRRIADHLRLPPPGPYVPLRRLDPDQVVRDWQAARAPTAGEAPAPAPPARPRRRWFHRRRTSA